LGAEGERLDLEDELDEKDEDLEDDVEGDLEDEVEEVLEEVDVLDEVEVFCHWPLEVCDHWAARR